MSTLYLKFAKDYFTWRVAGFNTIFKLSELPNLPTGCMLHVLDNLITTPYSLVPTNNVLMGKTEGVKYIFHNTKPFESQDNVIQLESKGMILGIAGVNKAIMDFKKQHGTTYRLIDSIDKIPARRGIMGIISHDSMFRVTITGQQASVRRFNYVFSNLINIVKHVSDREHFIHIPMNSISFQKQDFLKSFKVHDRNTIRYPEIPQYLFMMHLLGWIEDKSNTSLFEHFTAEDLSRVIFVLTHGDKCVFYRLSDILELKSKNNILLKVLNQVNTLVEAHPIKVGIVEDNLITIPQDKTINIPTFNEPLTEQEEEEALVALVDHIDTSAKTIVEQLDTLTPAQKKRMVNVAVAYKDIKVGDATINKILTTNTSHTLEDNNLDFLNDMVEDKSMLKSTVANFDDQYMKKTFKKNLVSSLVSFNTQGMFLTALNETVDRNELNHLVNYTARFEDIKGRPHTVKFTLPGVDKNGNCLINGSIKTMKKQRIVIPICKVSPYRVTLSSNYTKTMVERNTAIAYNFLSYITKLITKYSSKITVSYGTSVLPEGRILPYEYTSLGSKFTTINFPKISFIFDYTTRLKDITPTMVDKITSLESKHGVYMGKHLQNNQLYFMDLTGVLTLVTINNTDITESSTFIAEVSKLLDTPLKPLNEWVDIKLLNKKVPVILLLCYRYGFMNMLNYLNLFYELYESGKRVPNDPSNIKVVFQDKTLVFHRAPIVKSLLFCGLNAFDLSSFTMEEMEESETYHEIVADKGLSFNYIRGIDNFLNMFIDPITRDILLQMKEPTDIRDLLIRATTLLTTEDHKPVASAANFRFRSYEKMAGVVYNELSRSLVSYTGSGIGANSKFSINPYVVKQRILNDQLMSNVDIVNPIHDIKRLSAFSHMGEGGRSADTFMIEDRKYPVDGPGTISEATIDSGSVAINAYLPMNPTIVNTQGLVKVKPIKDISPSELLSVTSLLVPGVMNDDKHRY